MIHILCITVFICILSCLKPTTQHENNIYTTQLSQKMSFIRLRFSHYLFLWRTIYLIYIIFCWPPGANCKNSIHGFPWKIHWELPLSRWSCSSLVIFPTIDFCVSLNINFRHLAIQNKMLYIMTETWKWYHNNVCL